MFNMKGSQSLSFGQLSNLLLDKNFCIKTWAQKAVSRRKLFLEVSSYLCDIIGNKVKNRVESKLRCRLPECPGGSSSSFWHISISWFYNFGAFISRIDAF